MSVAESNNSKIVEREILQCIKCQKVIPKAWPFWNCDQCGHDYFLVCKYCIRTIDHVHKLKKVELCLKKSKESKDNLRESIEDSFKVGGSVTQLLEKTKRKEIMFALMHAYACKSSNCPNEHCAGIKETFNHFRQCGKLNCCVCTSVKYQLVRHARFCVDEKCNFLDCRWYKKKFGEQYESQKRKLAEQRAKPETGVDLANKPKTLLTRTKF